MKTDNQQTMDSVNKGSSRRRFLGMSASGLTALVAGCTADTTSNDTGEEGTPTNASSNDAEDDDGEASETEEDERLAPPENGAVAFVYDDGPIEDYTQAFPVHQEFDAPATTGIITERIGRSSDWMDVDHLEELAAAGWEICSHTTQHMPVAAYELIENTNPGDTEIVAEDHRHGLIEEVTVEITDGTHSVQREVAGLGGEAGGDRSVVLEEPINESFAAGDAVIRYPEEVMHDTLGTSKRDLEALGFEVNTLLAPYDGFDEWSMEFVPEYYDGVSNARHGSRINDPDGFDPYATQRDYFIEFISREYVERDLDEIADRGALGVFGAHTFKEEVTEDEIRETLEWIEARNIEVMTFREAIDRFTG